MTDKPTPDQIQRACDLVNAERGASHWTPTDYGRAAIITTLAVSIAQLDAMQASRDAANVRASEVMDRLDKARADLAEIDRIACDAAWAMNLAHHGAQRAVAAIADPYRVETGPLVAEAKAIVDKHLYTHEGLRNAVAEALKRGLEIGRSA